MGVPLLLVLLLFELVKAQEVCSREDILLRMKDVIENHYLWFDRIKGIEWKDGEDFIKHARNHGDRWTAITKREEDRLWYSSSKMVGIGIRWDDKGYIKRVFPNSPAQKGGLREGDLMVSIGGTVDKALWRKVIREVEVGKPIKVEVIRGGFFMEFDVVKGEFLVPAIEEVRLIDHDGKLVGYVHITNFTQPALEGFTEVMDRFNSVNIDLLIIDLRDNGGGLISVARSMLDMLVSGEGVMFYLEGRKGNMGVYEFRGKKGFKKPIAVVVNRQTASAAELFTSVLKRYAGALIVGENTVGKYVGSNLYPLDDCGNVLRLVTFQMKLSDGSLVTTEKGIEPDCKTGSNTDPIEASLECLNLSQKVNAVKQP
ncbi:MAG: carboxyl-terminal protease [Acidobacteria bacterium]|nr:MAG: carboxyl-terminal protease [Acidobacteriota bacterium]